MKLVPDRGVPFQIHVFVRLIRYYFAYFCFEQRPTNKTVKTCQRTAAAAPAVAVVVLNHLAIIRTSRVELAGVQGITNPRLPLSLHLLPLVPFLS